ncbi:MAG: hypothetical protein ACRD8A_06555 [Candidatus Acidiferrales bacterium]
MPDINPLAEGLATAAGFCYLAIPITLQLMRSRANQQLPHEHGISWFIASAVRKMVIADYKRFYPGGWAYRALPALQALWVTFVILAFLALFVGSSR